MVLQDSWASNGNAKVGAAKGAPPRPAPPKNRSNTPKADGGDPFSDS